MTTPTRAIIAQVRPDLEELRRLANAATTGPWKAIQSANGERRFVCETATGLDLFVADCSMLDEGKGNATFVAAANPQTVLSLLDRIKELEAAIVELQDHGTRFDLNPSILANDWNGVESFYVEYIKRMDEYVRRYARALLEGE